MPQARDYRSPGGQQLVAAHKANAASIEVGYLIPYWGPPNRTVTSFVWRPLVTALRGKDMNGRVIQGCAARNDIAAKAPRQLAQAEGSSLTLFWSSNFVPLAKLRVKL